MTQTPNVGLKKIDGSENWRNVFDYHNDSMDLADEAIAAARAGLTYVENGDTIAANADYTDGKFICWKGEIYRVKATINSTVTSANWTTYLDKMDGIGGALSQINGDLATLNSKLTTKTANFLEIGSDYSSSISVVSIRCIRRNDGLCIVEGTFTVSTAIQSSARKALFTGMPEVQNSMQWCTVTNITEGKTYRLAIGTTTLDEFYTTYPAGEYIISPFVYYS